MRTQPQLPDPTLIICSTERGHSSSHDRWRTTPGLTVCQIHGRGEDDRATLAGDVIQSLYLDEMPSHNAHLTQRAFTSLIRSVRDQVTTLANNFSVALHAASQVQGLDESAANLVLSVLRGFERDIETMSRSNCQLRSAVQHLPALDAPKEHVAYDRLGSLTPPPQEYREVVGGIFGLGYGTVEETRSLRDCTPSPTALSASSSFDANALTPVHNGRVVGRAETPEWEAHTEAASSPPLSSLGGSFDNIAQVLAKQRLGEFSQETEPDMVATTPTDLATYPLTAHIDEWSRVMDSFGTSNSTMSTALLALPSDSLSTRSSRQKAFRTSTPSPPEMPVRIASSLPAEPPSPSPPVVAHTTTGMAGLRKKIELDQVELDQRARRSMLIAKFTPAGYGARRPRVAAVIDTQFETSGPPRPVLQLRGVETGHRARLNPVHRKAMVVDGAALEVADVAFAKSDASGSRVITGRTEVTAALDEMVRSQNAAILAPVPAQSASAIQPLVSSTIANTKLSSGDATLLMRSHSAKRKRKVEVEAENATAQQETPGQPREDTTAVKKSRVRVVTFAESSRQVSRKETAPSAEEMLAMDKFYRDSASATEAFKGKPASSKTRTRLGFLRR